MDQLFVYGSSDIKIIHLPFFLFRKVPLEEFDPQTQSTSLAPGELLDFTPALGCVTHLFYAYVRKATDTEFNVFVLGRDLILYFGFVIHSLSNFAHLSKYASESVCVRFYSERSTLCSRLPSAVGHIWLQLLVLLPSVIPAVGHVYAPADRSHLLQLISASSFVRRSNS
ncbi:galactosyltransferase-like protein [Dorcoceras hygrometricum]|uniref:Galactosyltransferase-like protein n=1 Tax=Dorcoceras hygrometricum TaxID=472368 RepID=A0A2Z7CAT2_9LAMI|nr:galactosyltransferase-like protein [Dorcoceras hygrometricum]